MTPLSPCFAQPLTPFLLVYSLFMILFFLLSTHTLFFPPLPLIWVFRSAFWNAPLLFSPQSRLFSSEQRLQRRRSVQFCHISLSSLCVFVLECLCVLTVCGPLQTGREINYTKALWLYNSCCGVILTAKERPLLSMPGVVGKGLRVQQLGFPVKDFTHLRGWRINAWIQFEICDVPPMENMRCGNNRGRRGGDDGLLPDLWTLFKLQGLREFVQHAPSTSIMRWVYDNSRGLGMTQRTKLM